MGRMLLSLGLIGWIFPFSAPVSAQANDCCCPDGDTFSLLPDQDLIYPLRGRDLEVQEALRYFARNVRVGIVMDETITGTVSDDFPVELSRVEYLNELAFLYDFVWYFDGQVLRISSVGNLEMVVIALSDNSGSSVLDILRHLGIYQPKFTHRFDARSRTLMVAGPTHYTEVVKNAVEAVEDADRSDIALLRGNESGTPSALSVLRSIENDSGVSAPSATN